MNDEFGVLKNMIPACQNQDMHKLAILQVLLETMMHLTWQNAYMFGRRALSTFDIWSNASPT